MNSYAELMQRGRDRHGEKFDPSDLDPRFARYWEKGDRLRIRTCDMVLTGRVGVSTGWRPCWLLMRTSRSLGSPWVLGSRDEILGVKRGLKYVAV